MAASVGVAACVPPGSEGGPPDEPTDATMVLEEVEVVRVEDGDSLVVLRDGGEQRLRLQGINAPERDECLGDESRTSLSRLAGSHPAIAVAGEVTDQYGRHLVHLFAGGVYVNQRQVEVGHAIAMSVDHPFRAELFEAQKAAESSEVGLWSPASCGGGPIPKVTITDVVANPPGPDDRAIDEEIVTIRNDGPEPIDLTGFVLRDESTTHRYHFDGVSLDPGGEVTVASGCDPTRGRLAWCASTPVWNNQGDTVILLDRAGRIAALART